MSLEKLDANRVKLTIEVSSERFAEGMSAAYKKNAGRFRVPGFRAGKAPRKVIENFYGEAAFYEYAFEELYPEAYDSAVSAESLRPVAQPELSIEKIGGGGPLVFTAIVTNYPDVVLGQYKGLEIQRAAYEVTEEDLDRELSYARERAARFIDVDRPVETGDIANMDYSGSVDGEPFDGGSAKNYELEIGSGRFIPGFEEGLLGMSKGEEKDLPLTFPEGYHAEDLKGKAAVFHVVINEIKKKELPELDDEFAKDVSEFDTLEEFKESIRARLTDSKAKLAKREMEEEALTKAAAAATIELPDVMVERRLNYLIEDMEYRLSMQGLALDQYFKMTNTAMDDLRAQYRPDAETLLRTQLVLDEIIKQEAIVPDDAFIDAQMQQYAEQAGQTVEEWRAALGEEDLEFFTNTAARKLATELLVEQAVLVEKKAPEAEERTKEEPVKEAGEAVAETADGE